MNPGPVTPNTVGSLRTPWFLGVLLLAVLWWTLDLAVLRAGVAHPADDHWEDHLIAERLLAGDGFRTTMIYPPLWGLRNERGTVPVLVHGPLLALLTVPALAGLGRDALDSVALPAALFAIATLIPIYRLGSRFFGAPVGATAAGLYTLSPLTLGAVHHSASVIVGACLLTWTLDLLARPAPRTLAAGLLAGLASLVRPEALLAMPVFAVCAWRADGRNLHRLLALAGGFAVCALPWWIYRANAVGSPFFNLTSYTLIGFWGARPEASVMQDFSLTPGRWPEVMRAELPGMIGKWIAFAPRAIKHVLFTPSGATGWLALVGLIGIVLGRVRRAELADRSTPSLASRFALCSAILVLIPVAAMTLTFHQPLYLVPFAPLLAIGAAAGVAIVATAMPEWARRPRAWIGLTALLVLPSALPALRAAASEARLLERRLATERQVLARDFPRGGRMPDVIFSDSPDFVAWVTGRPAVWTTEEAFAKLYAPAGARARATYQLPPAAHVAGYFHDDFRDPSAPGRRVVPGSGP